MAKFKTKTRKYLNIEDNEKKIKIQSVFDQNSYFESSHTHTYFETESNPAAMHKENDNIKLR